MKIRFSAWVCNNPNTKLSAKSFQTFLAMEGYPTTKIKKLIWKEQAIFLADDEIEVARRLHKQRDLASQNMPNWSAYDKQIAEYKAAEEALKKQMDVFIREKTGNVHVHGKNMRLSFPI